MEKSLIIYDRLENFNVQKLSHACLIGLYSMVCVSLSGVPGNFEKKDRMINRNGG